MRMLQEGVAAIRRGGSDPIPEKSAAMFGPLARELNILRDRVQMEPRVLASMGQLATGMAHEIHQPLQAIKFELELLRDARNMPGDDLENHVHEAKSAVDRMHRSVEGFLRVVRLKPMEVDSIQLNPLLEDVRDTLETTANLAGMELDLDLDPDLPETYADAQVLRQAIENLVRNAIQATPSQEGRVTIRSRSENDGLSLSVIDTGPGIPEAVQQKIFSFYFTTKPTGTGVGLALVRQAAEIHSGQIKIESAVGHGTTMTIYLPRRSG
jgi:signal transduction histidine kinase